MKNSLVSFKKKLIKTNILPVIGVGFLVFVVFWVGATIVIPAVAGDGLNNYAGLKRAIAESVLKWDENSLDARIDSKFRGIQIHIDEVRPTTKEEIARACPKAEYISNDPNDPRYYTVVFSERRIGTFTLDRSTIYGCEPWREDDPVGGHPFRYLLDNNNQ